MLPPQVKRKVMSWRYSKDESCQGNLCVLAVKVTVSSDSNLTTEKQRMKHVVDTSLRYDLNKMCRTAVITAESPSPYLPRALIPVTPIRKALSCLNTPMSAFGYVWVTHGWVFFWIMFWGTQGWVHMGYESTSSAFPVNTHSMHHSNACMHWCIHVNASPTNMAGH